MNQFALSIMFFLQLMMPLIAHSESVLKTPMSYSLQEYGVVLATALLGGLANWWIKVRKGEQAVWNIAALIGELCVSAFSGLMAFWLCEWWGLPPLLTAAVIGMSGHAGARGLNALESIGQRVMEKKLGIELPKETP